MSPVDGISRNRLSALYVGREVGKLHLIDLKSRGFTSRARYEEVGPRRDRQAWLQLNDDIVAFIGKGPYDAHFLRC